MNKFFYPPLTPWHVGQGFGENRGCVDLKTNSKVIACDGNNPPPGYRSLYGSQGHTGVDARAYHGQEVYAAQRGKIYSIDTNPRTGLDVRIESTEGGRTFRHIYEHLLGYQGKVGDWVETGQLIGWADNTGFSAGNHLHFQVEELLNYKWHPIDPMPLMADVSAPRILAINNTIKYLLERMGILSDRISNFLLTNARK